MYCHHFFPNIAFDVFANVICHGSERPHLLGGVNVWNTCILRLLKEIIKKQINIFNHVSRYKINLNISSTPVY